MLIGRNNLRRFLAALALVCAGLCLPTFAEFAPVVGAEPATAQPKRGARMVSRCQVADKNQFKIKCVGVTPVASDQATYDNVDCRTVSLGA